MKPPPRADPILLLLPALGLLGFVLGPGIVASASGLPAPARGAVLSAEEVAQALRIMATVAPEDLDGALAAREPAAAAALETLAGALGSAEAEPVRSAIGAYLVETSRSAVRRLAAATCQSTPPEQTREIARRLIVDADRFAADRVFRESLEPVLRDALDGGAPRWVRTRVLADLDAVLDPEFEWLEDVALSWDVAQRPSGARRRVGGSRLSSQGVGPIRLSVYSLPEELVAPDDAVELVAAVREARPERVLLIAANGGTLRALRQRSEELRLVLVDSLDRGYSPWPRDALTFLRDREGRSVLLLSPEQKVGRERDPELGRLLVQRLPNPLDDALGEVRWLESPIPFHNGQILETDRLAWISIHALERRALELLGLDSVPVAAFDTAEGLDRYLDAVRRAAAELELLLDQPVSFVHPLPAVGTPFERERAAWLLGGGAGFDLDSLLTLLPRPGQATVALVASIDEGERLLATLDQPALAELSALYALAPAAQLRAGLELDHRNPPPDSASAGLSVFLDRIAEHLAERGLEVRRLPLLWVSADLRRDGIDEGFLIGWNNVVFESTGELGGRAEGFASGIARGDQLAIAAFDEAGYRLDLLPPLVSSVLAGGGYRCASNHDRGPPIASDSGASGL